MDRILDLRHEQSNPPATGKQKHMLDRSGKVVRRDPKTVTGIVVHQTAVTFGASKAALRAANGDARLAKHRRALGVASHVTAFSTGVAVVANPLDWYVYNANALNSRILGLEIEGAYPGLFDGKELFTGEIFEAAKAGLAYLVREGRKMGMPLRWIWAHRQSSKSRRGDPGEEIWRKLVLEYAVPGLGLVPLQSNVVGDGRPIPAKWDPNGSGAY